MSRAACEALILIIAFVGLVLMLTQAHVWGPWVDGTPKPECARVRV